MQNRLAQLQPLPPLKGTAIFVTARRAGVRTRHQALRCAVEGLRDAWRTQPNLRLQVACGIGVVALGMAVRLSVTEWLWVSFAIGLVIFAELMNTAIEQTIDLTVGLRPDPLARYVKDVSAGSVLVCAILAAVIGGFTFLPHLIRG